MKLLSPKGDVSRPIIDRAKESLFDVLYNYDLPDGVIVADLFSGVGSLGLEAASRGARFVTFVEQDREIEAVLKKNIEKAGFVKESKVICTNAFKAGAPVGSDGRKYGLVFVDPPYPKTKDVSEKSQLGHIMEVLSEQVENNGIVVVRTEKKVELLDKYACFKVIGRRTWGTMTVTFLRNGEND